MRSLHRFLVLPLPAVCCLAFTACGNSMDSDDVAGAVATTIIKAPFVIVGAILDGDDDDHGSDSSIGKRHVARQASDRQPIGAR